MFKFAIEIFHIKIFFMNGLVILLGVGLLVGINYISTGTRLQNLQIRLGKIDKIVFKLLNSYIKLNLNIRNPNQKKVNMQQMLLKVTVNGSLVADIDFRKTISINPADTAILQGFVIELNNFQIIQQLLSKSDYIKIRLYGKVQADGHWFPYDETSTVNVKTLKIEQ